MIDNSWTTIWKEQPRILHRLQPLHHPDKLVNGQSSATTTSPPATTRGSRKVPKPAARPSAEQTFKDQSYVLYCLTQNQLAHTLSSPRRMTKAEIRLIAEDAGLVNARNPTARTSASFQTAMRVSERRVLKKSGAPSTLRATKWHASGHHTLPSAEARHCDRLRQTVYVAAKDAKQHGYARETTNFRRPNSSPGPEPHRGGKNRQPDAGYRENTV